MACPITMIYYKTLYSQHGYIKFHNKSHQSQYFGGKKKISKKTPEISFCRRVSAKNFKIANATRLVRDVPEKCVAVAHEVRLVEVKIAEV